MSTKTWDFLKESETSLGLFYPLHYIVAGYTDLDGARAAEAALRAAGTPGDDVRAASGEFVAGHLESRDEASWLEQAKTMLANSMGTEMVFLQTDKKHARHGGAFLFFHAPEDTSVDTARQVFVQHPPVFARRYLRPAIQIIIAPPNPGPVTVPSGELAP